MLQEFLIQELAAEDLWFLKGRPQWQQYQQLWGPPETIGTWQAYYQGPLDYPLRHGCVNEIPFYCKKAVSPQVDYGEQGSGHIAEDDDRRRRQAAVQSHFQHEYLELGASARKTLSRGPLPSFRTASCMTSRARAADEALSNLIYATADCGYALNSRGRSMDI